MQYQPNPTASFEHSPNLKQAVMHVHVRQGNSRKNKVEVLPLKRKTFCSGAYEINGLGSKLLSQSKRGTIDVDAYDCCTWLKFSRNQCLTCTTPNIKHYTIRFRYGGQKPLRVPDGGGDGKFFEMIVIRRHSRSSITRGLTRR